MDEQILDVNGPMDVNDPEVQMGMTIAFALSAMRKGIHSRPEVEEHIADGIKILNLPISANEQLDKVIGIGLLVQIGERVCFSEQGRLMCNVLSKKLAVAELIGENTYTVTPEEVQQFKEASEDLPG